LSRPSGGARGAWLALAAWTALVLTLSSDAFGASGTSRILVPLLRAILPFASEEALALVHGAIRKSAHVIEYAVLGGLALRAFVRAAGRPLRAAGYGAALLAFAYGLAVATADEARQSASRARTGARSDVLLDTAGAAAGIAALDFVARRRPVTVTGS
jgi:VanZ family protein